MSRYKVKSQRELEYEENKDYLRAKTRFEASIYYKHKVNERLAKLNELSDLAEANDTSIRLTGGLPPALQEQVDEIDSELAQAFDMIDKQLLEKNPE